MPDFVQHEQDSLAQLLQRVHLAHVLAGRGHVFHRQPHPFAHGVEQVALVPEVPVDRAAADLGRFGNMRQRRARNAIGMKYIFGRIEDAVAGFQCFFLGRSGHTVPVTGCPVET